MIPPSSHTPRPPPPLQSPPPASHTTPSVRREDRRATTLLFGHVLPQTHLPSPRIQSPPPASLTTPPRGSTRHHAPLRLLPEICVKMDTLPSAFNKAVFACGRSVVSVEGRGTAEHVVRDSLTTREGEITLHVPTVGNARGRVILHDNDADVAVVMIPADSVISGEALRFSEVAAISGRDIVMLGYFSMASDIMNQPGTSHGYAEETVTTNNLHYLEGSYTAKGGNSGSPVCIVEDGGVFVIGMMLHELIATNEDTGEITRLGPQAITVESIQSSLRKKLGLEAEGMTMQQMVRMIIRTALLPGPPGGADG